MRAKITLITNVSRLLARRSHCEWISVEGARPLHSRHTEWLAKTYERRITYMGLLDNLQSMFGGGTSGDHASVATELMNAVQQHPGGLSGMLDNFKQNGMGDHVNSWQ